MSISATVTPFSRNCASYLVSESIVPFDAMSPAFSASSRSIFCRSAGSLSNQMREPTRPVIRLMWPVLVMNFTCS